MANLVTRHTTVKSVLQMLNKYPERNYIFLMASTVTKSLVPVVVDFKDINYAVCSMQVFMALKENNLLKRVNTAVPISEPRYHYYLADNDREDTPKIAGPVTAGSACPNTNNAQLK